MIHSDHFFVLFTGSTDLLKRSNFKECFVKNVTVAIRAGSREMRLEQELQKGKRRIDNSEG